MGVVGAWLRLDLRRRWRALLVLAVLVAVTAGTVVTVTAGALRARTAVDRLVDGAAAADAEVLPGAAGLDWDRVRELPEVEALATYVLARFEIDGRSADATHGSPVPVDAAMMRAVERPAVLAGRLADPARADEAVATTAYLDSTGKRLGDIVSLRLYQPETTDLLAADPTLRADGPTIDVRIVGIVRSPLLADSLNSPGLLVPSAGLYDHYAPHLVGASGSVVPHALVHLDGGATTMPGLRAGLTRLGGTDVNVWEHYESQRFLEQSTAFESGALMVFALAAATVMVFVITQGVVRHVASSAPDLLVMRALGMTPAAGAMAVAAGPTLAALTGVVVALAGALAASAWFPVGTAALLEPSPGIDADLRVMTTAFLVLPALAAAAGVLAFRSAVRASGAASTPRRSTVAAAAARAGLPVPVVVGTRYAFEPGRGRNVVPVRPALAGIVAGVLGVVAASTIAAGVGDAVTNPARFGQVHQLEVVLGYDGVDLVPADAALDVIAADPDVVAVNDLRMGVAAHDGGAVAVYSLDPMAEPLDLVVTEGRLPNAAAEIALAPYTATAMGAGIGDPVRITGAGGPVEMAVTGFAFVPEGVENYYMTGAWATSDGYDALVDGFRFRTAYVVLEPGTDAAALTARLTEAAATEFGPGAVGQMLISEPISPDIGQFVQVQALPVYLAVFLAALAVVAAGHALWTVAHRRRRDLGVLRALGMTRRQCRGVFVSYATTLALAGVVAGIPLGVALGRTVWRTVTDMVFVHYVPPTAALALALIVPCALVMANLLAAWPSHRATSLRVGHVLRSE